MKVIGIYIRHNKPAKVHLNNFIYIEDISPPGESDNHPYLLQI